MSTWYSLSVIIDAKLDHKIVEQILEAGQAHHFIYFKENNPYTKVVSPKQGASKLLSSEEQARDDGGARIFTKFEDTYFSLWIDCKDSKTEIYMGNVEYSWKKAFANSNKAEYFDFARYIRLLLILCKDFPIISLETVTL